MDVKRWTMLVTLWMQVFAMISTNEHGMSFKCDANRYKYADRAK